MSQQDYFRTLFALKSMDQREMTREDQGYWFAEAQRVYWEWVASELQELSQRGAVCQTAMEK